MNSIKNRISLFFKILLDTLLSKIKKELNEADNVAPFYGYLISAFTGYWGYQESDVWQWLKLRGL